MMKNRKTYLVLVSIITLLSTYQLIDLYLRFRFLVVDILNNLTQSLGIYFLFTFFISITGYLTIIYQWKLLKGTPEKEVRLLDNPDSAAHHKRGWMYSIYLSFSVLIIGLGVFLVAKPLQENYPIEKLPDGLVPYFIVLILTGLGMVLFYDVIKIKRIPKETNQ